MAKKNVLLIEPGYKNKYPPLGLMKLAQYHGPRGKNDRVRFIKGEDRSALSQAWDRIYVTTLFSFEYPKIAQTIDFALEVANGQADKVFVGGIAASLMHSRFLQERRWQGVRFIKGLLSDPPAVALQLDEFSEELYADDIHGQPIEDLVPDYSILDQIDYKYPVRDAYFAYTSRGCIRKCHFCGVPKLEGGQRDTESLTSLVRAIDELYGPKKDLTLMDNNVVASPRFKEIIAEIRDLGFTPGAKLLREGMRVPVQRRVDFNQGVDARILCKDPMYLRELAICLKPLRIAFDHLGVKKPYEQAVRYAAEYGLTELSNYMLYNFHDDPADLFERMRLNVKLNEELGVRIWSFPMRYQPTDRPDRGHVGEKWSRYQLRSMQVILQATHGIVSGAPNFFKRAFGDTFEDYERILLLPHDFIFNRDWYERFDPEERLAAYRAEFEKLDGYERTELVELLSSCDPREFTGLANQTTSAALKRILRFYVPLPKNELFAIWAKQKEFARDEVTAHMGLAEDELVEDAGLDHEDEFGRATHRQIQVSREECGVSIARTSKVGRATAETGKRAAERHELPEVVIGKDVLELVSSAMYIDPMTVYREYVQNAADAVDTARAGGAFTAAERGRVNISVDPETRTVRIRDNGCGLPFRDFGRKLTALGGSVKRGTPARGFRGVGRLAGLGYAQELIFRSRVPGEARVSQLRWDCRRLKAALREAEDYIGATDLIRSVTALERLEIEDAPERFFEVEMRGIVRLRNDRLMSPSAISEYLSQVAPVPFSPAFRFTAELTDALSHHVDLGALDIQIDGTEEPVYRPHRDSFSFDNKQSINFDCLSVIEIPGIDCDVAAVAWVLHHEYEGAVPTGTLVKGLRLRAGNVQVGDHVLLEELFPEPRFNAWSVGEVHVIDRRIVPNGRRDHFEQNAHFHNLINHLTPTARDITRRCRTSSIRRKWDREFESQAQSAEEMLAVIAQGGVRGGERERLALSVEQTLLRMSKVAAMDLLRDEADTRSARVEGLRTRLGALMDDAEPVASPLMRLPAEQREVYQKLFELVYECSANRVAAKSLIDRIMMRLEQ